MSIDLTVQIHQYLTTAPSSLFAQQKVETVAQWKGDANLLWRVRSGSEDAVVKLFLDAGQARSRRQFDAHQLFAPLGLAPHPLWADRYPHGLSRQLIVYRWVEGDTIAFDEPGMVEAWAEAVGMIHAVPAEELRRISPHPLNLEYYWSIEQQSIAQVNEWLAPSRLALAALFHQLATAAEQMVAQKMPLWSRARPTAIHGDLSGAHTLVARGRVLLLDWESFGLGDPAMDVARLFQREAQTLTSRQIEQWLARYSQIVDDPEIVERIEVSRRLLDLHNVVYLLVGLQQHTKHGVDPSMRDALPFIEQTLNAALERAARSLRVAAATDAPTLSSHFVVWLDAAQAAARSSP